MGARVVQKKKKRKVIEYQRWIPRADYMKHWRIVRMWAMARYGITMNELEIILALYSNGLFTHSEFNRVVDTYSWDRDRLQKMIDKGFIVMWRKRQANEVAKYEVTRQMRKMCLSIYRKLDGLEAMSEHPDNSPFHHKSDTNDCWSHRQMRKQIRRFNIENGHTVKPPLD